MMDIRPNCGPHAIAVLLDLPVSDVESRFRELHRKGPQWKGKSNIPQLIKLARSYGCKLKTEGAQGSLRSWMNNYPLPGRRYLVRVGGHFLAIVNGEAIDQHGPDRANELANRRVTHAFWIVTNDSR